MAGRYRFSIVEGHKVGKRAIGFLEEEVQEGEGESRVDGKMVFEGLRENRSREVRTRFDYWLDGGINDKWFHGWPNDREVKECFCFKWKDRGLNHRLYGFLSHPQSKSNPSFQLCTLAFHDAKNDESTNRNLLIRATALRGNPTIQAAIGFMFPDERRKEQIQ